MSKNEEQKKVENEAKEVKDTTEVKKEEKTEIKKEEEIGIEKSKKKIYIQPPVVSHPSEPQWVSCLWVTTEEFPVDLLRL